MAKFESLKFLILIWNSSITWSDVPLMSDCHYCVEAWILDSSPFEDFTQSLLIFYEIRDKNSFDWDLCLF